VVGLVLISALHVLGRGGGRSSGGSRGSSSYSYRSYSSNSYHGGGYGGPMPEWAIILIVLLVAIVIICICCSVSDTGEQIGFKSDDTEGGGFSRSFSYEGRIPCYLCLSNVRNSEWDSGEHRKRCAFNNQRELLSFPQPYDAYCPNCKERLRLWPAKGHPFYCDECPYNERTVLKRSTGENRLNCFLCDFDCCVNCSDKERFQQVCSEARQPRQETAAFSDTDLENMPPARAGEIMLERLKQRNHNEMAEMWNIVNEDEDKRSQQRNENERTKPCNQIANEDDDFNKMSSMKTPSRFQEASQPINETEQTLPSNPTMFSTPPSYTPVAPSNNAAMMEGRGNFSTPFIIPQQENPPAYPADQYNLAYPIQPTAAPSSHPSLPYAISPYTQTQQTETPPSSDFAPSAPPFIKPY